MVTKGPAKKLTVYVDESDKFGGKRLLTEEEGKDKDVNS